MRYTELLIAASALLLGTIAALVDHHGLELVGLVMSGVALGLVLGRARG
jgi:hypothetical protein